MRGGAQSTVVCILTGIHGADCSFTKEEVNMRGGVFLFLKGFGFQYIILVQTWFANTAAPINHVLILLHFGMKLCC